MLYFDYNATTPLDPQVLEAMLPYLSEHYGNPSSLHSAGRVPAKGLREARREAAQMVGALREEEIVFTSGGTESNTAAIRAALNAASDREEIITSRVEHSSVLKLCRELAAQGYTVHEIGVDEEGRFAADDFFSALSEKTALVALMLSNNETGVYFPLQSLSEKIKEAGAFFLVDAVQSAGKMEINAAKLGCDYLSLSAHKFYGPKGSGILYHRKTAPFSPLVWGGSQERKRRGGTENVPGIVGTGKACELARKHLPEDQKKLAALRNQFEENIQKQIPHVRIHGREAERLVNTSNMAFKGVDSEALLAVLDQKEICVSSGSACMSGAGSPSHVIQAMGFSDDHARATLRFSFGRFTNLEDVDILTSELKAAVQHIRSRG